MRWFAFKQSNFPLCRPGELFYVFLVLSDWQLFHPCCFEESPPTRCKHATVLTNNNQETKCFRNFTCAFFYDLHPGSKTRKIPYPTKNPFTWIFLLVSCPNYTYEVTLFLSSGCDWVVVGSGDVNVLLLQLGSWLGFTVMTQCVPVAFFTLVGFIQMTVWAKGKHRSYLKEFRDYPPLRSPILPFVL